MELHSCTVSIVGLITWLFVIIVCLLFKKNPVPYIVLRNYIQS